MFGSWLYPPKFPLLLEDFLSGTHHQRWKIWGILHTVLHPWWSIYQWLFMVPVKGGRWHIIPQLAVCTTYIYIYIIYIPLTSCLLGGYRLPTTFCGNQKQPLNISCPYHPCMVYLPRFAIIFPLKRTIPCRQIDHTLGGAFKYVFIFTPTWGWFPFWLIFFNWVETTN